MKKIVLLAALSASLVLFVSEDAHARKGLIFGHLLGRSSIGRKAPMQVTPGIKNLKGEYHPSTRSKPEPYSAHYDQYGRQIGRTDYTNQPNPKTHTNPHHHTYKYDNSGITKSGSLPSSHPLDK